MLQGEGDWGKVDYALRFSEAPSKLSRLPPAFEHCLRLMEMLSIYVRKRQLWLKMLFLWPSCKPHLFSFSRWFSSFSVFHASTPPWEALEENKKKKSVDNTIVWSRGNKWQLCTVMDWQTGSTSPFPFSRWIGSSIPVTPTGNKAGLENGWMEMTTVLFLLIRYTQKHTCCRKNLLHTCSKLSVYSVHKQTPFGTVNNPCMTKNSGLYSIHMIPLCTWMFVCFLRFFLSVVISTSTGRIYPHFEP